MRLRNKPWVSEAIAEYDFVYPKEKPADETQKGRWREVMGVGPDTRLYVELGTGKGDFITQLAARDPEAIFIGIEAQQVVLYSAAKKLKAMEPPLTNVRLLVFDINNLEKIFAPGEVSGFTSISAIPGRRPAMRSAVLLIAASLPATGRFLLPGARFASRQTTGRCLISLWRSSERRVCGWRMYPSTFMRKTGRIILKLSMSESSPASVRR